MAYPTPRPSVDATQPIQVWDLEVTDSKPPPSETSLQSTRERHIPGRNVKQVDLKDMGPGGKYRAIVKLFMRFEKQGIGKWCGGTGWLIQPNIVVTAGHCVYERGIERALQIKVWVGYHGPSTVQGDTATQAEFRYGERVATSESWITGCKKSSDIAFIKLVQPFGGITPIRHVVPPKSNKEVLGVVGFPCTDRLLEQGHMYEDFGEVAYDIPGHDDHLLTYKLSTYEGSSGAPILRPGLTANDQTSLGVHTNGDLFQNSGTPLGAPYGIDIDIYLRALDQSNNMELCHSTNNGTDTSRIGREISFKDAFWSVISIDSFAPVDSNLPFVAPVGGPLTAVAGAALTFAGKDGAEVMDISDGSAPSSLVARGTVAEAALQVVLNMTPSSYSSLGLEEHMARSFGSLPWSIERLAPYLFTPFLELAGSLRESLEAKQNPPITISENSARQRITLKHKPAAANLAPKVETFTQALLGSTCIIHRHETFREDELGDLIVSGLRAGSFMNSIESSRLDSLSSTIPSHSTISRATDTVIDLTLLGLRAIVSEAALRAMIDSDISILVNDGHLDRLKDTIQIIGPPAMESSAHAFKEVNELLKKLQPQPDRDLGKDTSHHNTKFFQTAISRIKRMLWSSSVPRPTNMESEGSATEAEAEEKPESGPAMPRYPIDLLRRAALGLYYCGKEASEKNTVFAMLLRSFDEEVNLDGIAIEEEFG